MKTMNLRSIQYLARTAALTHPIVDAKRDADSALKTFSKQQEDLVSLQRDLQHRIEARASFDDGMRDDVLRLLNMTIEMLDNRMRYVQKLRALHNTLLDDNSVPASLRAQDSDLILAHLKDIYGHFAAMTRRLEGHVQYEVSKLFLELPPEQAAEAASLMGLLSPSAAEA